MHKPENSPTDVQLTKRGLGIIFQEVYTKY